MTTPITETHDNAEVSATTATNSTDRAAIKKLVLEKRALKTRGVHGKKIWIPFDLHHKLNALRQKKLSERAHTVIASS